MSQQLTDDPHQLSLALGRAFSEAGAHGCRTVKALGSVIRDVIAPRLRAAGWAVKCSDDDTLSVTVGERTIWLSLEIEKKGAR